MTSPPAAPVRSGPVADRPVLLHGLALRPDGSGVTTYVRELLRSLTVSAPALGLAATVQRDAVGELAGSVRPVRYPVAAGTRRALLGLRPVRMDEPVALVHGLDVDLPLRARVPTVTTVHDLSVFDVPETFSRAKVAGERLLVRSALRRADAVVTVSAFTTERVRERFGRQAVTVPLAAPTGLAPAGAEACARARARFRLPERFVLHVGTVEPRKDVDALAAACVDLGVPLILAGSVWRSPPSSARHLGFVDRGDLPALYGAATVVAYPSRYEGFGLPPVEAAACGAPVLATRVGALPEALGDAAVLVAPGNGAALRAGLRVLLFDEDHRAAVAAAGRARVAARSWADVARETLDVYRSLGLPC